MLENNLNSTEHNSVFTSCISYLMLVFTHYKMWLSFL